MLSLLRKGRIPESRNREHQSQREKLPGRLRIVCTDFLQESGTPVRKICDKIKNILENIAFYKNLWNDPDTQGLLKHAGKRFGHIWKRLRRESLRSMPRSAPVLRILRDICMVSTEWCFRSWERGSVLPRILNRRFWKGISRLPDILPRPVYYSIPSDCF